MVAPLLRLKTSSARAGRRPIPVERMRSMSYSSRPAMPLPWRRRCCGYRSMTLYKHAYAKLLPRLERALTGRKSLLLTKNSMNGSFDHFDPVAASCTNRYNDQTILF
jgi:hypothetical protein